MKLPWKKVLLVAGLAVGAGAGWFFSTPAHHILEYMLGGAIIGAFLAEWLWDKLSE